MTEHDPELARMHAVNDEILAASFDEDIRPELVEAAELAASVFKKMVDRGVDPVGAIGTTIATINAHLVNHLLHRLGHGDPS